MTTQELQVVLTMPQFPISAKYDAKWILENQMGPCALWLLEFLMEKMTLKSGMRVLDMGCGMGMTSIFLAKEYGVTVVANDLWINATDNYKRFREAGLDDKIIPIHADARTLPYAEGYFDAIISIDSYFYYGTDAFYLDYFEKFLKQGGQIGIVYPALTKEFDGGNPPSYMMPFWDWSMYGYHSPEWWASLWHLSPNIEVEVSDLLPNGYDIWFHWEKIRGLASDKDRIGDYKLLEADNGNYLTFGRTVGRKVMKRW